MSIPVGWKATGNEGSPGTDLVLIYVLPPTRVVESGCICSDLLSGSWLIVAVAVVSIVVCEAARRLLYKKKYLHGYSSWLLLGFPCSLLCEAAVGLAPLAFS